MWEKKGKNEKREEMALLPRFQDEWYLNVRNWYLGQLLKKQLYSLLQL